jgi:hypothetical protein
VLEAGGLLITITEEPAGPGHMEAAKDPLAQAPEEDDPAQDSTEAKQRVESYQDARFVALDQRPLSDSVKALADQLAGDITKREIAASKRSRKRSERQQHQLADAVARLTADLLTAAQQRHTRWSYALLDSGRYSGAEVPYRSFKAAYDGFQLLGYVQVLEGYFQRDQGFRTGKAARLRATEALFDLCAGYGITPETTDAHFYRGLPSDPLVLKRASARNGGQKVGGRRMGKQRSETAQRLRSDVQEINTFLDGVQMEGGKHAGYRRIFNEGDRPDFNWNKGGRLYSVGDENYQRMKKRDRLQMRLDGQPVAEIDVKASFLTILYALHGQKLDFQRDPYEVPGVEREVVKQWVTMTLGFDRFHKRWPPEAKKDLEKDRGRKLPFTAPQVQAKVLERHPILKNWPEQKTSCFDLMFLESEAVVNTILRLKREHGVPCLSVHDSVVVPVPHVSEAKAVLAAEYEAATSATPMLEVEFTDGVA